MAKKILFSLFSLSCLILICTSFARSGNRYNGTSKIGISNKPTSHYFDTLPNYKIDSLKAKMEPEEGTPGKPSITEEGTPGKPSITKPDHIDTSKYPKPKNYPYEM